MISIPFSGNKRYSYKRVKQLIEDKGKYTEVYEPFGGSCVISVNLYLDKVVDKVIINDYDGLFDCYEEFLDIKDWLVNKCLEHGIKRRTHGYNRKTKENETYYYDNEGRKVLIDNLLCESDRTYLQSLVAQIPEKYWPLLCNGANFTHSAVASRKARLNDFRYFMNYIYTDRQRKYLAVVRELERSNLDYKAFIEKYKGNLQKSSIFVVDPPYPGAYQNQYVGQFTEEDTLELLRLLKDLRVDFIFFNHDMEQVKGWFKRVGLSYTSIEYTGCANNTANHKRRDVMVYVEF